MNPLHALRALRGVVTRELLRFVHQRERFVSALVRPLVWLFIFAAGFRSTLGLSPTPPYETYILYEDYITPGLVGMIQLFNGMQSSLSMVYDREMGNMRTLLVSPLPRWFLLVAKLLAGTLVSVLQAYAFLLVAWFYDVRAPIEGYLTLLPALVLADFAGLALVLMGEVAFAAAAGAGAALDVELAAGVAFKNATGLAAGAAAGALAAEQVLMQL